jgi:hypothetical protein
MNDARRFSIVFDGAGDPRTVQAVMPTCPACTRMLNGDVASYRGRVYHLRCAPKEAR